MIKLMVLDGDVSNEKASDFLNH